MGLIISVILGFLPALFFASIIYWFDRFEKEPLTMVIGVFLWGAIVAAGASFLINTTFGVGIFLATGSESLTDFGTSSFIAPVVEEVLKGLAVLLVFLFMRREFDSILDGIIYAAIAALGFSATENAFYIYDKGYLADGMAGIAALTFIRVIMVGWQHPFYTSFVGIGLAAARLSTKMAVKILAPLAGLSAAIFTHSFHNTLATFLSGVGGLAVGAFFDWSGWLAMLAFILYSIGRERNLLVMYLQDEIDRGILSRRQFQTACSPGKRDFITIRSLFSGMYLKTREFYQLCGELAHRKYILAKLGQEFDNAEQIARFRSRLREIGPKVMA